MINLSNLVEIFTKFDEKLVNRPLLISVRRGLTYMIPLVVIGSFALIFISLPIPAYQSLMLELFGEQWKNAFLYIRDGTFNILSLIMVISISYSYITDYGEQSATGISPIIAACVSLSSFIAISGISKESFSLKNFGVIGVFIAILVAVVSSKLFLTLSSIKALRIKVFTDGANTIFNSALTSFYPAALTIAAFAAASHALTQLFDISDIQSFLSDFFSDSFSQINSSFWSGIIFISLIHIFWFFGMHGSNILEPVAQSLFVPALEVNRILFESGLVPTEIFTKTFFDSFVLMGGCGTSLCLMLAIVIAGRHKNQLQLARLSMVPVVFNINELIVFGIPIVLNPIYIIPFLFVPIMLTATSFLAMYNGLVPYTSHLVEWTTPIFLSGYISTRSISGSFLQLFNVILGTLCYIPFVRLAQGVSEAQRRNHINKVFAVFKQDEECGRASALLARQDDTGTVSRFLASELESDLDNGRIKLLYQPQVDYNGNVFGAEALLRWDNEIYGMIYPPLIIALAEESRFIDRLGYWIMDTACKELKRIGELGFEDITVSVNVSAAQLEKDSFVDELEQIIQKHEINPNLIKIEITEQLALTSSKKILYQLMAVKKLGVQLAMDDFGMGHSSLMYMKEYEFNTIKIDGSLVRELLSNRNCKNIISSIMYLSKTFNCSVIAEYVETKEQLRILHELGCDHYQGYLYSKAITGEELCEYIKEHNNCRMII